MSVADKLLQVNQVKQDIKTAIETKGIPMTNVAFTEYANKILDISGGGGGGDDFLTISYDEIEYFGWSYYMFYRGGHQSLFANTWNNHNKRTTLFDGNITFEVTDDSLGIPLSFYSGDGVDELYDLLENGGARNNEALKITVNNTVYDATSIDSVMNTGVELSYVGGEDGFYGVEYMGGSMIFLVVLDTTILGMSLGKVIAFFDNEDVNYLKIESGFNHYYENGIIIPDGVEIVPFRSYGITFGVNEVIDEYFENNDFPLVIPNSVIEIGEYAFYNWEANNQPLVIPNSVTSIGYSAFRGWTSNNQSLIIPNSVIEIGEEAFRGWVANNQPLVIPNSVTSIGTWAFTDWTSAKEFIMESETPPTLAYNSFANTNNAPIYVPNNSVAAYKAATNWVELADRIFPISDR